LAYLLLAHAATGLSGGIFGTSHRVQRASQLRAALSSELQHEVAGPVSWRWIDGSGRKNTWQGVLDESRHAEATRKDVEVHVACDSAVQGRYVVFATVVCVIAKGNAGKYFYSRQVEEKLKYPVLQTRLLREVQFSLDTAEALTEEDVAVAQVHCDSNTDPGCKSTEHTRMLIGYIQAMGYAYRVKPNAWATFVADRHSRGLYGASRRSMAAAGFSPG